MSKTREQILSELIDTIQQLQARIKHIDNIEDVLQPNQELFDKAMELRAQAEEDLKLCECDIQDIIESVADEDEKVKLEFFDEFERKKENPYMKEVEVWTNG